MLQFAVCNHTLTISHPLNSRPSRISPCPFLHEATYPTELHLPHTPRMMSLSSFGSLEASSHFPTIFIAQILCIYKQEAFYQNTRTLSSRAGLSGAHLNPVTYPGASYLTTWDWASSTVIKRIIIGPVSESPLTFRVVAIIHRKHSIDTRCHYETRKYALRGKGVFAS